MLQIEIPSVELYDDISEEFFSIKGTSLRLEHSLVSISKWEAKWKKPFLNERELKTTEQSIDYVRCMTLNQNVNPKVYYGLTKGNMDEINNYINSDMTATWFNESKTTSREIVTSELIYYWMVAYNIPWEAQKWHLSRLLTLIRICNIKNAPPKKMSKSAILRQNKQLNQARRKALHSRG